MRKNSLLALFGAAALLAQPVQAVNIVPGFTTSALGANDDSSTGSLAIGFNVNFFGNTYSSLWANNNGNLTFNGPLGTFTPFNLYTTGVPIIAPFFADVDTRGVGSNLLRYGQGTYNSHSAFGATWDGVGYYSGQTNKLNKFQVVLENRADIASGDFDIHFFYDQIQWETGGASGGSNGLGGNSARVGYSNGTALNSYELTGSAINGAFLDTGPNSLVSGSNIGDAGHYRFSVRNGTVIVSAPDGGSMLVLLGLALAALAGLKQRRN
ncbi:MAG: VPDSG-CTERM sorting domain-containing protein [Verrucomicrobia bacterium]|nr:VPDSG-CTERM sorting domain-containing protein [Verrucomicrobiota bacterium]